MLKELLKPPFLKPPPPVVPPVVVLVAWFVLITLNPASASAFFSALRAFSAALGSRDNCLRSCRRLRC